MATSERESREQGIAELAKGLSQDLSTLARQELELGKAEMREKARTAGPGIGMLAGAAVVGLALLGALTAFLILVLELALAAWLAALIVTLLWAAVVAALALLGRQRLRAAGKPVPEQMPESVKEDVEQLKESARSARQ
jgi:VIT1/CCC1 family predicted Fe2+/Mn2+ transporter